MYPIAYIISAYKDAPHLKRLIEALEGNADFYVHVDSKVDIQPFKALLHDKVVFVKRHWVSWGGWEQVEYQKELLKAVIESGKLYCYVVCLSAQDYPIWNRDEIHKFFKEQEGKEFIAGYNLTHTKDKVQRRKIIHYHFFRDLKWKWQWWKYKVIVPARHIMRILPIRKKPTTIIEGKTVEVYFGSDYWAITLDCARYVYEKLCTENDLIKYFRYSYVPSELCIQTIVFNSRFASKAILHTGEQPELPELTPLHHIEYGAEIKVFTREDLPILRASKKMFCRKVVSGISDSLVAKINATDSQQEM